MIRIIAILLICLPVYANAETSVTQYGITYYFSSDRPIGRYANGDYWVLAPVTITQITPDWDGVSYGWEVNPSVSSLGQAFDTKCYGGGYDASLMPALPYTASAGDSIVKTTPDRTTAINGTYRPCINTAVVLTVVGSIPANNGATVFRPPYSGTTKTTYLTDNLRTSLLPTLAPVASTPTLATVASMYQKLQMDHRGHGLGRALRPNASMPDYGGDMGQNENQTALRLMLNDSIEAKMPALINFVQTGIDIHAIAMQGQIWPRGGGEQPCHILPYAFAAVLLGDSEMAGKLAELQAAKSLYNDYVLENRRADGTVLWGDYETWSERSYWSSIVLDSGSRTQADPYHYIDGGKIPGDYYQYCCTSMIWKGFSLAFQIMPVLKTVWNRPDMWAYVDRWVTNGAITQPDPCAPTDHIWTNYGITYGPNGSGGCILDTNPADGIGRFPSLNGTNADAGYRQTDFQNAMWAAYRGTVTPMPTCSDYPDYCYTSGECATAGYHWCDGKCQIDECSVEPPPTPPTHPMRFRSGSAHIITGTSKIAQ